MAQVRLNLPDEVRGRLRVGAKIPSVRLGPLPAAGMGLILVMHFAGLVTVSLVLLLILSGVVV